MNNWTLYIDQILYFRDVWKLELLRYDVYSRNQTGFITDRPLEWAVALESYLDSTTNLKYKWLNRRDAKPKINTSKIIIYYDLPNKKEITLNINFATGLFMVYGKNFKSWINTDFPKVASLISGYESQIVDLTPEKNVSGKPNEIENLLDECNNLRSITSKLDNSNLNLTQEVQRINSYVRTANDNATLKLEEMQKSFDTKISVFLTTLTEEMKKYVDSSLSKINKSIDFIKNIVDQFKSSVQNQIDDFTNKPMKDINHAQNEILTLQKDLEKIDFEGLSA